MKDYIVGPNGNKWQAKQPGAEKASGLFGTQQQAIQQAKTWSGKAGGGEVTIQRPDGRIRDRDTVAPKVDKFPPHG